jgi:hypothetical protein
MFLITFPDAGLFQPASANDLKYPDSGSVPGRDGPSAAT